MMKKLFIAGHRGMVGSALLREAARCGSFDVLTATREALDLCDQAAVFAYLAEKQPEVVIIAAAKVGGIHANATYPAAFIYENLTIASNLVEGCRRAGVGRVLFLGSSCIYPKLAPQPMPEDCLLSGTPRREFLHVDDLAKACFHLLALDNPPDWVNVGVGSDLTILELAALVGRTTGFGGAILTDPGKPDGTPRKLLDVARIHATGWGPRVSLEAGLAAAYEDFKAAIASGEARL